MGFRVGMLPLILRVLNRTIIGYLGAWLRTLVVRVGALRAFFGV